MKVSFVGVGFHHLREECVEGFPVHAGAADGVYALYDIDAQRLADSV